MILDLNSLNHNKTFMDENEAEGGNLDSYNVLDDLFLINFPPIRPLFWGCLRLLGLWLDRYCCLHDRHHRGQRSGGSLGHRHSLPFPYIQIHGQEKLFGQES